MKFRFNAGAELDMLTQGELRAELAAAAVAWRTEQARGITWRKASMFADSTAGGALLMGESGDQRLGPDSGMVWKLHRISVSGGYVPASHALALYADSVSDSSLIVPDLLTGYQELYGEILTGGQTLVLSGTATASTRVWVTVLAQEAPEYLAWKL